MAEIRTATRFTLIAIEDGVQVSGTLRADGSLSQSINLETGTVVPNLNDIATLLRPNIYPVILKGAQYILPTEGEWRYDENKLEFDETTKLSKAPYAGVFKKTTRKVGGDNGVTYEALQVMKNLVDKDHQENIGVHQVCYVGKVDVGQGNTASFHAEIAIRIATMSVGGFMAVMTPEATALTDSKASTTLRAFLYDGDGKSVGSQNHAKWYVNGVAHDTQGTANQITLNRDDVDDHAVIECVFHGGNAEGEVIATAIGTVDDTTDPYQLQIGISSSSATDVNNLDRTAILHSDDEVKVWAWLSENGNPSVVYQGFTNVQMYIKEYDANGTLSGTDVPMDKESNGKFTHRYRFANIRDKNYSLSGTVFAQITE